MKRICYLLLWLLTGFSIAANENGARQTHLLSSFEQVCAMQEAEETGPSLEKFFSIEEPENEEKSQSSLVQEDILICSAKR